MKETQTLIVGAGPVGLTLAVFLKDYGVNCRIIDKRPTPTQTSNAVAIHARTLELFQRLGLAEKLIKQGKCVHSTAVGAHQKTLAHWDLNHMDSDYPFALCIPQNQTEAILIEHLQKQGVVVERSMELIELAQNPTGVSTTIKAPSGMLNVTAHWLVGCDGYHSTVREKLKFDYPGNDLPQRFIMIDAPILSPPIEKILVYTSGDLTLMLFPMPNSVRIAAEVSQHPDYVDVDKPDKVLFERIAKECLPFPIQIGQPLWTSKFWIHERLANHYQKDHIFLAGDAAHAHSPAGGQGMNTGMQDAINLAWKLALVTQHQAPEALLDSYELERRPVAQSVIDAASRMTQLATSQNSCLNWVRDKVLPLLASLRRVQKRMVNQLGETAISYKDSPIISSHHRSKVKPGSLCPLRPYRSQKNHLLLYRGNPKLPESNLAELIHLTEVQAKALGLSTGYCVVRPDGYIGYIGNDLVLLNQYFHTLLGRCPH